MQIDFNGIGLLLLTAAIVAMVARQIRVPYAAGLVLSGVALVMLGVAPALDLTGDLIYTVLLPPLVFEAALYIEWHELRRELGIIGTLATAGVLLSAAVVAAGMHFLAGWRVQESVLFGSLIAATDPVSVIATFRASNVTPRLRLLVESESLINDSTAAILFGLALAFAAGDSLTPAGVARSLFISVAGGIGVGGAVATGAILLARRTHDHLVERTFTMIAAYGSFLLAERVHGSGVLASLTAGLIIGNVGLARTVSADDRAALMNFWEFAAFLANSIIFILIGMRVAKEPVLSAIRPASLAIALVLLGRASSIYPLSALFRGSARRVTAAQQHVLFWGGLRGALALALALALPDSLPDRGTVITVTFAVAAFSIVVQGMTIQPLLVRLGEITAPATDADDGAPPAP